MSQRFRGNYIASEQPEKIYGMLKISEAADVPIPFPDQIVFDTPGTYTWIVPANVTSVSAVAVGGGGGGYAPTGGGGGGGALAYLESLTSKPGTSITVVVGDGGEGTTNAGGGGDPEDGGDSYVGFSTFEGSSQYRTSQDAFAFSGDGTQVTFIDTTSDDPYTYRLNTAFDLNDRATIPFDLSNASEVANVFNISSTPRSIRFKPDGTKFYTTSAGSDPDDILEYTLSTAWDISTATLENTFSSADTTNDAGGIFLKPDGTKLYVVSSASPDTLREFDLSTAWDISTASLLQTIDISGFENDPMGIFFKPDGTKAYITGTSGDDVNELDLTVAWDISTASLSQTFSVSAQASTPSDIFFSPDGTIMVICGYTTDDIFSYQLSTAWDVSTAVFYQSIDVSLVQATIRGIDFKPDGTRFYFVGNTNNALYEYGCFEPATQIRDFGTDGVNGDLIEFNADGTRLFAGKSTGRSYNLASPYNPASASLFSGASGLAGEPYYFNGDGTKVYATSSGVITEYECKDAFSFNQTIAGGSGSITDLRVNSDGTEAFILYNGGDIIYGYELSTPYSFGTATAKIVPHLVSTSNLVSYGNYTTSHTGVSDIFIDSTGTRMYLADDSDDSIFQYELLVEGFGNSGVLIGQFSVASQATSNIGISFSSDGTKMFVSDLGTDSMYRYDLSTAWDVTTASYTGDSFAFTTQDSGIRCAKIKADGTQMFSIGTDNDRIYEYDLSVAYDITTASYTGNFLDVASPGGETVPLGFSFDDTESYLYVVGATTDDIQQYELSTPGDITSASYVTSTVTIGLSNPAGISVSDDGKVFNVVISSGVYVYRPHDLFNTASEEGAPRAFDFKPDGTKMFVVGQAGDDITQYTLSTPFQISSATVDGTFSLPSFATNPIGIRFNGDGTVAYVTDAGADNAAVVRFATPWDITTASVDLASNSYVGLTASGNTFSVAGQDINPTGLTFKSDGTKMYMTGSTSDTIFEYDLSVAWDVSTSSYTGNSFSFATEDLVPDGIHFKSDGTKLYMVGRTNDSVYEYDLSVAWDVSSASFNQSLSVASQETNPSDLWFKPDGTKLYIIGYTGDDVNEYDLSVAWDISTASLRANGSVAGAGEINPQGLAISSDGQYLYTVGYDDDDLEIWSFGTPWDITTLTFLSQPASGTDPYAVFIGDNDTRIYILTRTTPTDTVTQFDLLEAVDYSSLSDLVDFDTFTFNSDGTKVYASDSGQILRLSLGTAYDLSTATPETNSTPEYDFHAPYQIASLDVSSQDTAPDAITFGDNGTKLFMIGNSSDTVHRYDLSVAYDITTASYSQDSGVIESTTAFGLHFKPDGTKMYVVANGSDDLEEYDLATPWDLTTKSLNSTYSVGSQENTPVGLYFKSDGTQFYIVGDQADNVHSYTLTIAWDISTATYTSEFTPSGGITTWESISFNADGTELFLAENSGDIIYGYTLTTAWDISTANTTGRVVGDFTSLEATLFGFYFTDDGNRLFITGTTGDAIIEVGQYNSYDSGNTSVLGITLSSDETKLMYLSTNSMYSATGSSAGDMGTFAINNFAYGKDHAVATGNTFTIAGSTDTAEIRFSSNNQYMYFPTDDDDKVKFYELSTPGDITTATLIQDFTPEAVDPTSIVLGDSGNKAYIRCADDTIYQYSLAFPNVLGQLQGGGGNGAAASTTRGLGGVHLGSGGGDGGDGGNGASGWGGGGGGAGGYNGDGGNGGTNNGSGTDAASGSGGGGGSGSASADAVSGGGVGLLGLGADGTGGTPNNVGTGGSGGEDGTDPASGIAPFERSRGGLYGGGGGGGDNDIDSFVGNGGQGAIRIIWGANRTYPSTNTTDQ